MTPYRPAPFARPAHLVCACVLLAGLGLGGCARDRDTTPYPSLAVRPVEKQGFAEPVVKPVPLRPDPALDAKIADMAMRLGKIEDDFAKAYEEARVSTAKARGDKVGSDAWLTAQTQLAGLDDIYSRTSSLLSEIDADAIARANVLDPPYPALTALRERAVSVGTQQQGRINALSDSLPAA